MKHIESERERARESSFTKLIIQKEYNAGESCRNGQMSVEASHLCSISKLHNYSTDQGRTQRGCLGGSNPPLNKSKNCGPLIFVA